MQPVPSVTVEDVERIVHRDFPPDQYSTVMAILKTYGTEKWQHEEDRVRLAVLKLAAGSIEQLQSHIDVAKQDYRDVLAYAEYPNYMRRVSPSEKIAEDRKQEIIDQDWLQYQEWFKRR
jgi:hypothetical protein